MTGNPDTALTIDTHHRILPDFFWRETNENLTVGSFALIQGARSIHLEQRAMS